MHNAYNPGPNKQYCFKHDKCSLYSKQNYVFLNTTHLIWQFFDTLYTTQ